MTDIVAQQLTAEAFAPFGYVSETGDISSQLSVPHAYEGAQEATLPLLNIVRMKGIAERAEVSQLEIHPYSNQTFLPLDSTPSMIVVCEKAPDGTPDASSIKAFIAQPNQIVTYRQGVLHHLLTPIGAKGLFAMTMRQTGRGDDTVLYELAKPVRVTIPD